MRLIIIRIFILLSLCFPTLASAVLSYYVVGSSYYVGGLVVGTTYHFSPPWTGPPGNLTSANVRFTSATPSTCSVVIGPIEVNSIPGSVDDGPSYDLTAISLGQCTIQASQLTGPQGLDWSTGGPIHSSQVVDGLQTITFPSWQISPSGYIYAYASSGLPISFSTLTPDICVMKNDSNAAPAFIPLKPGICTIAANQAGNDYRWYPAPEVTQSVTINEPSIELKKPPENECSKGTDSNAPGLSPNPSTATGDPVDLSTGVYYDTLNLMRAEAAGAPLQMALKYSSGNIGISGKTGAAWRHAYEFKLVEHHDSFCADFGCLTRGEYIYITLTWPDGHISTYNLNVAAGVYSNTIANAAEVVVKNVDGTFTLTDRTQKTYTFFAAGQVTSGLLATTVDRLGFVRNFSYLNGNLDKVTDALSGRFIQFGYDGQNRVTSVTGTGAGTATLAYDLNANLASVTDALGNTTNFTYDANHRLLTKVNALGVTVLTNTYNASGKVDTQDDGLPATPLEYFTYATDGVTGKPYVNHQNRIYATTQYNFDTGFKLTSTIDPLGGTESDAYDATTGQRASHTDPLNNTSTFTYDTSGYILTRTDANGNVASYTYDVDHNITSSTDEVGHVTTMTYGSNHQLLTTTEAGHTTTNTYNAEGLLATVTEPNGGVTSYTYDGQGNLSSQTDAVGFVTTYTYDAAGRVLTRSTGVGHTWTLTYDLMGNVLSVTDPLAHITSYTYDALGRMITKTTPDGGVTSFVYNIHNNLISLTDPLLGVTTYTYDANDQLISSTDALGHTTTLTRDAKGRITAITDALGYTKALNYNAADDVTTTVDAQANTTNFAYDNLHRLTAVVDPLAHGTTQAYDAVSRVTSRTDPKSGVTSLAYDALGQLTGVTNAMAGHTAQAFDANGNRTSFTDANGNVTTYTQDLANRITSIATADGGTVSYTYNSQNLVATATNGRNQVATYTYDNVGQLLSMADPAGTITFTYDVNGNVLTVSDAHGTLSYTYDLLNRITSHTDVFANVIGYGYDAVGKLTTLTYPGNKTVTYTYGVVNRLLSVTDWSGHVTSYSYDASGNMTGIWRANGTHGAYTYDANGQLTAIAETTTGNASLYSMSLTYNANGNITSENTTPATTPPNIPVTTMTYGADNRLATVNGQAVTYDADGNMTSGPLNGTTTTYSFDARSQLTGVGTSSYTYNALGDRISATNSGITTRYVVDPNTALSRVLMETDAAGTPIAYYVYGKGLISRTDASANYRTYHYDPRGSTLMLTNASGTVTDTYQYGLYGELAAATGTTANPFRYNGRDGVMTEANGLYFMRARYYLPEAKRFVNRDTLLGNVADTLTLNRFAYVNGNPTGFVDPSGNEANSDNETVRDRYLNKLNLLIMKTAVCTFTSNCSVLTTLKVSFELASFIDALLKNPTDNETRSMFADAAKFTVDNSNVPKTKPKVNVLKVTRPEGCHSASCIKKEWVYEPGFGDVDSVTKLITKAKTKLREKFPVDPCTGKVTNGGPGVRG